MSLNPVVEMLDRRLRLGVIGGGPGSFIGEIHRQAARMDGRYELVAAALSSNPERAKKAGRDLGLSSERVYTDGETLLKEEAAREDGIDVVAIMTPNDSHFRYASEAMKHNIDVICDKPITNTVEEAEALHTMAQDKNLIFCLTHNYTGYPMVRQAKAMVDNGELGTIRLVQVEYVQGGKADENDPRQSKDLPWRFDPVRGGKSLVMGDIGTHAHNLLRFITSLEVDELSAEAGTIVPDRLIHDYAGALLHMNNGARGVFWVTQAAAGVENCLRIRVSGTKGSLEWNQELPQILNFKPLHAPAETRTPKGPGTHEFAARSSRIVAGHPEGFPEAFANIYSDAAEAIAARRSGKVADPLAMHFPNSYDGLLGIRFVEKIIESSEAGGAWTKC